MDRYLRAPLYGFFPLVLAKIQQLLNFPAKLWGRKLPDLDSNQD